MTRAKALLGAICLITAVVVSAAEPTGAVQGGEEASQPWAVAIVDEGGLFEDIGDGLLPNINWWSDNNFCSGSLIAPDKVLTAAHCLSPELDLAVIGRANVTQDGGHVSRIASIAVHPCYVPGVDPEEDPVPVFVCADGSIGTAWNWDVAILTLEDPTPAFWRVLPLAPAGTDHLSQDVELFGYGKTQDLDDAPSSTDLLMTPTGTYSSSGRCVNADGNWPWVLCFDDGDDPDIEVLPGDSGAPWTWTAKGDRVQIAVHSGGSSPNEVGVDVVVETPLQPSPPFQWVRDQAGIVEPVAGTILRNPDDGNAWLVGTDGYRRPIPTGGDYQCFEGEGASVANLAFGYISQTPEAPSEPATCTPSARPAVSTALIVDSSGSMSTNDPQNRRLDAALAYVAGSLLSDEVGVVDFDSSARIYSEAVEVASNRDELEAAISRINSSGGTNLGRGLDEGCAVLERASGERRAAIFFTDGSGAYSNQVQCFVDNGWQVHTVGLGRGTNAALLEQIASASGGSYRQLDTASNLVCEFQQIRAQIAGLTPGSCAPTATIVQDQVIDFDRIITDILLQLTFTTTWQGSDIEMTVTSPSGVVYNRESTGDDVVVRHGATYETITVVNPEQGRWQVQLLGAEIPPGGEPFTFSTLELGDEVVAPVPVEHVCISTNGVVTEQSGSANCDSGPGGSAVARGDGATALALGTNSHATAIGVGSYASTNGGDRNRATARNGGRAEASNGDRNSATATTGTAIAQGGSDNVASASQGGFAEIDADRSRATAVGGTAVVMGGERNVATSNGLTSSATIVGGTSNSATAFNGGAALVNEGSNNRATARGDNSMSMILRGTRNSATANTGSYAVSTDGERTVVSASRTSVASATGVASRSTASSSSGAHACDGARVTSVHGAIIFGEGCVEPPPFGLPLAG